MTRFCSGPKLPFAILAGLTGSLRPIPVCRERQLPGGTIYAGYDYLAR